MCEPSQCSPFGTVLLAALQKEIHRHGIGRSVESVSGSTKEKYHVKRDVAKSQQALDAGKEQITLYEIWKAESKGRIHRVQREELQKKEDL